MAHIDFYFDFSCPYAYIGSTQIEAVAERNGASLTYKPMLLGGVFRGTGLDDSPTQLGMRRQFAPCHEERRAHPEIVQQRQSAVDAFRRRPVVER